VAGFLSTYPLAHTHTHTHIQQTVPVGLNEPNSIELCYWHVRMLFSINVILFDLCNPLPSERRVWLLPLLILGFATKSISLSALDWQEGVCGSSLYDCKDVYQLNSVPVYRVQLYQSMMFWYEKRSLIFKIISLFVCDRWLSVEMLGWLVNWKGSLKNPSYSNYPNMYLEWLSKSTKNFRLDDPYLSRNLGLNAVAHLWVW
jgi:hypothetical protein